MCHNDGWLLDVFPLRWERRRPIAPLCVHYLRLAKMRHQYRLRTLLVLMACIGVYITAFKLVWHWTLLLTGTAVPVIVSLIMVRRWARLTSTERTVVRATAYTAVSFAVWLFWVVFVILGPGESIFNLFADLVPGVGQWNGVWR